MTDYPAAHSMDTGWFAVDDDGCIAFFLTGESGALPEGVEEEPGDLYDAIKALPVRGEEIVEPYGNVDVISKETHVPESTAGDVTVLADNVRAFGAAARRGVLRRTDQGVAVHYDQLPPGLLSRLHAAGHCRSCFYDLRRNLTDEPSEAPSFARRGLFRYGHICENWISGPYGRESSPSDPMMADALPADVRQQLVRLEGVNFARQPFVQPAAIVPCASWEVAWLDLDGKHVYPFRDQEYEAKETYGRGSGHRVKGLVVMRRPRFR